MSSKDFIRAGESGGRRAAIREVVPKTSQEKLPSHIPLPKPTRDISASNRSQSIILQDLPLPSSDRRILDRDAQQFEYQRQANIVYTRQFKILGKLLGNQSMDFDEIKMKVQELMTKQSSLESETNLKYKIQSLERELARKEGQRSSQYIANSEYIKTMEAEIERRNKLIAQLSESVKKEDFQGTYKELQREVSSRDKQLRNLEDQMQEVRTKSASQIGTLQEELIKKKQSIQKLQMELDTLKLKHKILQQQHDRTKQREKELQTSLEVESKGNYQGISYSTSSLILQLQTRDRDLIAALEHKNSLQQENFDLQYKLKQYFHELQLQKATTSEFCASLQYSKSLAARQNKQIEQLRALNSQTQNNIKILSEQVTKNHEQMTEYQKKIISLEQLNRQSQIQLEQYQTRIDTLNLQITEVNRRALTNQTEIVQLKSQIGEKKNEHKAALINLSTIQDKMMEEVEAKAKIELLLHQKEQELQKQKHEKQILIAEKHQEGEKYLKNNQSYTERVNTLVEDLRTKEVELNLLKTKILQYEEFQKTSSFELETERKHKESLVANNLRREEEHLVTNAAMQERINSLSEDIRVKEFELDRLSAKVVEHQTLLQTLTKLEKEIKEKENQLVESHQKEQQQAIINASLQERLNVIVEDLKSKEIELDRQQIKIVEYQKFEKTFSSELEQEKKEKLILITESQRKEEEYKKTNESLLERVNGLVEDTRIKETELNRLHIKIVQYEALQQKLSSELERERNDKEVFIGSSKRKEEELFETNAQMEQKVKTLIDQINTRQVELERLQSRVADYEEILQIKSKLEKEIRDKEIIIVEGHRTVDEQLRQNAALQERVNFQIENFKIKEAELNTLQLKIVELQTIEKMSSAEKQTHNNTIIQYQRKIHELQDQVNFKNNQIQQYLHTITSAEERTNTSQLTLKRQVDHYQEEFLKKNNEIEEYRSLLHQKEQQAEGFYSELQRLQKQLHQQSEQQILLQTQIEEYEQSIQRLETQKEEGVAVSMSLTKKIAEEHEGRLLAMEISLNQKVREIELINHQKTEIELRLAKQSEQHQLLLATKTELQTIISTLQQQMLQKQEQFENLREQYSLSVTKAKQQKNTLSANLMTLQKEIKIFQGTLVTKNSQIDKYRQQIKILEEQSSHTIKTLEIKVQNSNHTEDIINKLKKQLEETQNMNQTIERDRTNIITTLQQDNKSLLETNMVLQSKIQELIVQLQHKVKLTEEKVQIIHSLENQLQKNSSAHEESTKLIKSQLSQSIISEYSQKIQVLQQQIQQESVVRYQLEELRQRLEESKHAEAEYQRKSQEMHHQEEEMGDLRCKVEEQEMQIHRLAAVLEKVTILEEQLHSYEVRQAQLKGNIQEMEQRFEQKEKEYLTKIQIQENEIEQIQTDLLNEKQLIQRERLEMTEKLQILHEQVEKEKENCELMMQVKTNSEQQLLQIQKIHQEISFNSQTIEAELVRYKRNNDQLKIKIHDLEVDLQERLESWLNQKKLLTNEIDKLNNDIEQHEDELKNRLQTMEERHKQEEHQFKLKIEQLEQYCLKIQQDKVEEREQSRKNTQHNELQNCTFNFYEPDQDVNSESPLKEKDLLNRIDQLEGQLQELRNEFQAKSTDLVYSKSQEEESLKLMLTSLQEERDNAEKEIERLKKQDLARAQDQKLTLQNSERTLRQQKLILEEIMKEKDRTIEYLRVSQSDSQQLVTLKIKYQQTLTHLQENNKEFEQQICYFKEQISLLKEDSYLHKQASTKEKEEGQARIKQLLEQNQQLKKQQIIRSQELNEINVLMQEITEMKEQIETLTEARKQLQTKNADLQNWNSQLQNLVRAQKDQEDNPILSKLSKKSNVSREEESKRQASGGDQPSSDGELSRKIFNLDPSKISGQQSKFNNVLIQYSKIHFAEPSSPMQEVVETTEIKEQKNEESVMSKTIQQRERSVESSQKYLQQRRSEPSRRQTPKEIVPSQHDIAEYRAESSSRKSSHTNSIHSRKQSHHSKQPSQHQQQERSFHHELTDQLESNISKKPQPDDSSKNQEYLPQHSSKKTIQSNPEKKPLMQETAQQRGREEHKYDSFQKKIHIGTIPPIYIARPSIINNVNNSRRESNSKSNSRSKITISYGKPADKSIEMKTSPIHQVPADDKSQLSKRSSRLTEMRGLIDPPNQISPISIKRPDTHQTPNQSLQTSTIKPGQSEAKILRESFVKPIEKVQSESIIRNTINVRFSAVGSGHPTVPDSSKIVQRETSQFAQSKISNVIGSKFTNLTFRPVQGTHAPMTYQYQSSQPQALNLERRSQMMKQEEKKSEPVPSTPMKVTMKRLESGKRNSGFGDTLTFGNRTRKQNDSVASSSSSDSGIEVMQYDWNAPCCKVEP